MRSPHLALRKKFTSPNAFSLPTQVVTGGGVAGGGSVGGGGQVGEGRGGGGLPLNICFPSTILIYKPQDRRTQSTLGWGGRRWTGAWGWKAGATSTPPPTPLLPLLSSLSYPPSPILPPLPSHSSPPFPGTRRRGGWWPGAWGRLAGAWE